MVKKFSDTKYKKSCLTFRDNHLKGDYVTSVISGIKAVKAPSTFPNLIIVMFQSKKKRHSDLFSIAAGATMKSFVILLLCFVQVTQ